MAPGSDVLRATMAAEVGAGDVGVVGGSCCFCHRPMSRTTASSEAARVLSVRMYGEQGRQKEKSSVSLQQ